MSEFGVSVIVKDSEVKVKVSCHSLVDRLETGAHLRVLSL